MVNGHYMIFMSQDDFTYHLQQHKSYPLFVVIQIGCNRKL
jgi:hypothetical protein